MSRLQVRHFSIIVCRRAQGRRVEPAAVHRAHVGLKVLQAPCVCAALRDEAGGVLWFDVGDTVVETLVKERVPNAGCKHGGDLSDVPCASTSMAQAKAQRYFAPMLPARPPAPAAAWAWRPTVGCSPTEAPAPLPALHRGLQGGASKRGGRRISSGRAQARGKHVQPWPCC